LKTYKIKWIFIAIIVNKRNLNFFNKKPKLKQFKWSIKTNSLSLWSKFKPKFYKKEINSLGKIKLFT
jgi:hypothetical protein